VIRWIRERLGTAPYSKLPDGPWTVIDVRHLVDKAGNAPEPIAALVRSGAEALRGGGIVVVACDFGVSRSNAIAAGILSIVEERTFDAALRDVLDATGETEIKLELALAVRAAVESATVSNDARRSVLVTGAGGFLGSAAAARLREFATVLSPARAELDLEAGAVALADYCRRGNVSQIVHLAYPRRYTDAASSASSMVMLRAILDVCRMLQVRLVFVSGTVVFGGYAADALMADESLPLYPKGVYGETKYVEELLVDLAARRGEIERAVCRFSPVYGPGGERPRFLRTFYDAALRGETITTHRYRNGRPAADLLHVADAVDALARVVQSGRSDVFHVGTGELRSTAAFAETIGRIAGRDVALAEILIDDDIGNVAFPARKARDELDWAPRVTLEDGLASTLSPSPQATGP
jgi:nucleoside-diphosphate-sugar epimerase